MIASTLTLQPVGCDLLEGLFCRPVEMPVDEGERQCRTAAWLIVALNERVGALAFLDMLIFNPPES